MRRAAAMLVLGGCGLGVGPYQPKRDAFATAGGARPDLHFDEAERRAEHQKAKQLRVRELGGGETPMYAFDGGYYVGVKQGASQTRAGDAPWSSSVYAFEAHAGFFESVLRDHVVVGTSLFGVGYGTGGSPTAMSSARYFAAGLELAAKVGLTEKLSLRTAAGRMRGRATLEEGTVEDEATTGAWRAAAGLDWVVARIHGNDLVLTIEAQVARSGDVMLMGATQHVEARALMFELVLVGI